MTFLIAQMLLCLLVAFLLGLLLGWWLGRRGCQERLVRLEEKLSRKIDGCRKELDACRKERDAYGSERAAVRKELEACQKDLAAGRQRQPEAPASAPAASAEPADDSQDTAASTATAVGASTIATLASKADAGSAATTDDLTRIEGIGPKIEGLLNGKGITTWAQLAETDVSLLQSILDDAGPRYRVHDPSSWPGQAKLATDGAWEELAVLQDRLQGGRDVAAVEPDDLKRIEGIGPKIEGLLNARGISTWKQLAKTDISLLQSVLDAAGPRYRIHDPGSWPRQAELAASSAWEELDVLQDQLKGGRES